MRKTRRTEYKQDRGARAYQMEKQPELKTGGERKQGVIEAKSHSM